MTVPGTFHENEERLEPAAFYRIRTGDTLVATVFPPLAWAIPRLVPEGFGLCTGPPKVGNSRVVLGFALAVAAGTEALGKVPTGDRRPVLYLALEDGERRLQGRCRHLLSGRPIPANFHYLTTATAAEVLPVIAAWLTQHGHRNPFVLVDTLGKVLPAALPGEGAYQRDYRIGSRLKELSDGCPGSTLLVVHHTRKAGSEDWMDSTSGTNGSNGAADFTLNLCRSRNEDGILRLTGRDVPESEYAVTNREGRWEIDGTELADAARKVVEDRTLDGLGDNSARIVCIVAQHPEGVGPTEIAREMGIEPMHAGEYLSRLVTSGRIVKLDRGRYAPLHGGVETVESVETEGTNSTDSTLSTDPCEVCGQVVTEVGVTSHATSEVAA